MPKVVFITLDGAARVVDAQAGESVMAVAVRNGVPGIIGECGGNCSCATCHVYVDNEFSASVGGAGDMEDDLLDLGFTRAEVVEEKENTEVDDKSTEVSTKSKKEKS